MISSDNSSSASTEQRVARKPARWSGPATVTWTAGGQQRRVEVDCHCESTVDDRTGAPAWEGYLVDRVGVLIRVSRAVDRAALRTAGWQGEIRFVSRRRLPPPLPEFWGPTAKETGPPKNAILFDGIGEPPF